MNSLYDSGMAIDEVEVPCATLDDLFVHTAVDALKIDAEGAEPMILRGAHDLVARNPDLWMVLEIRPQFLQDQVHFDPAEYLGMIHDMGFETYFVDEEHMRLILWREDEKQPIYGNLLAIPHAVPKAELAAEFPIIDH